MGPTVIATILTMSCTAANMAVFIALEGRESAWLCLATCVFDKVLNALILHIVCPHRPPIFPIQVLILVSKLTARDSGVAEGASAICPSRVNGGGSSTFRRHWGR